MHNWPSKIRHFATVIATRRGAILECIFLVAEVREGIANLGNYSYLCGMEYEN